MPSDVYKSALIYSANVNEKAPDEVHTDWTSVRYGAQYDAGFMLYDEPEIVGSSTLVPGKTTMDGLRVTDVLVEFWRRTGTQGSIAGTMYAMAERIDPNEVTVNWESIQPRIGEPALRLTRPPVTSTYTKFSYRWDNLSHQEGDTIEGYVAHMLDCVRYGQLWRGNFEATVSSNNFCTISNERGDSAMLPSFQFDVGLVVPFASEMYPNNGYMPPTNGKLTWKFDYDPTNVWGELHQNGATIQIDTNGNVTEYTVLGEVQEYNIASASANFSWRVKVTSEHGQDSEWSEWCPVQIVDSLSTAQPVRPINVFVDASAEVLFQWLHVINTGTAQTGYELQYKLQTDSAWTALASGTGSTQQCTVAGSALPSGTLYWRVRTSNADNAWGSWSDPVAAIVQAPPAAPSISAITGTTIPTIAWQATGQQGYEVSVDGVTTGTVYGTDKSYKWPSVLADGAHTIGVRVINEFSLWSEWAYGTFTAQNHAGDPLELTAAVEEYGVALYWTDGSTVEVWRDGKRIATASNSPYVDYTAAGTHQYFLRRMGAPEWAPMGPATWQQGTIGTSNGANAASTTVIRTSNFIFIPSNKIKLSAGDNFMFGLRLYDAQSISSFTGGDTTWNTNEKEYDVVTGTYVRYVMRYLESGTILPAEGENLTAEYERINQDYYTDSNTVTETMTTQDAAIAVDGVWDWLPLIWTEGDLPGISTSLTPVLTLTQYSGRTLPAAEVSMHQTRGHDISYALFDQADRQKLVGMLGRLVWYRHGDQIIRGILTSVGENRAWWGWNESMHIEEVSTSADG